MTDVSDVVRAARLVAAFNADDHDTVSLVVNEARGDDRTLELVLAITARTTQIAREFYDTDCQMILDQFALDTLNFDPPTTNT